MLSIDLAALTEVFRKDYRFSIGDSFGKFDVSSLLDLLFFIFMGRVASRATLSPFFNCSDLSLVYILCVIYFTIY